MTLCRLLLWVGAVGVPQLAAAGGLFLPGSGAVSTSRAGAAVASADDSDPRRLVENPNIGGGTQPCNPTAMAGCGAADREGPDPINPLVTVDQQVESPIGQGDFKSHYVLFMLGFSTWF